MTLDGRISITPQALYAMADEIEANASRIEISLHSASRTLDNLVGNSVFQGDSAGVLLWRYQNVRGQMSLLPGRIRAYAVRIRTAGEAIEKVNQTQGSSSTALMCVAPTFLGNGGAWIIRRKDGKTSYFFRDRNGLEYSLPEGFTPEQGLQILDNFGNQVVGGLEKFHDLKLEEVSQSVRAKAYLRHPAGWKGISSKMGTAGDLIDAGLITYAGYRWIAGENGDYYESSNIGSLRNGTQIVYDKYIERDADEDFVGGVGGVVAGAVAGAGTVALIAYVFGAPVTVPATIVVGAVVFGATFIGTELGDQGATNLWRGTIDYEPAPPETPKTDLRFTAHGVEGRAAYQSMADSGRIDLDRLLDADDGEVVLQRDLYGRLVASGGVNGVPSATVFLD